MFRSGVNLCPVCQGLGWLNAEPVADGLPSQMSPLRLPVQLPREAQERIDANIRWSIETKQGLAQRKKDGA